MPAARLMLHSFNERASPQIMAGFCRETHGKPYLDKSEGEALGVRQSKAAAFVFIPIFIGSAKAAAALPHSKAPFGRELSMLP
jgi:hypothetical protein